MKRSHAVPSEKTRGGSLGPCHLSRSEPSPGPHFAEEMKAVFLGFRLLKLCLYVPLFSSPSCLGGRHCSPLCTPPSPLIRQHRRQPVPCRLSSPRCSPWHLQAFASPGFRFSGFARPPVRPTYRPAHELGAPAPPFFTLHSPPEPRPGRSCHTFSPEWLAARLLVLRFSKPTLVFADFAFARLSLPSADVPSFSCRRRRSAGSLPPLTFPLAFSRSFSSQQCEYFPKPSPR